MVKNTIRKPFWGSLLVYLILAVSVPVIATDTMLTNGGFEKGWSGWSPLWLRENSAGSAQFDPEERHRGKQSLRVKHTGAKDWCVNRQKRISVQQTKFDNGMTITVNFGDKSYRMKNGYTLKPLSKRVVGGKLTGQGIAGR